MKKNRFLWITAKHAGILTNRTARAIRKAAHKGKYKFKLDDTSGRKHLLVKIVGNDVDKFWELGLDKEPERNPNESGLKFQDFKQNIPDHYIRIAQLKAQLCNEILVMIEEGDTAKKNIYERMSIQFSHSKKYQELRNLFKKEEYSERSLQRMVSEYLNSGKDFMALVPKYKKEHNRKRAITDDELFWLKKQLFNPGKNKIGTAIKYIKYLTNEGTIKSPSSVSTLRRAANDLIQMHPNEYHLVRYGEDSLRNNRIKSLLRDWSHCKVGDIFVADGHTLNFTIIDPKDGKPKRMVLIVFMDIASRCILGASIAPTEDTENISSAFRQAVLNLGRAPKTVYIDNGKAFKAKYFANTDLENEFGGLYDRLGCKVIFAEPYNPRAKLVERFFRTFGDDFERKMLSFVGASLPDKPAHYKRTEDWLAKRFAKNSPTLVAALRMMENYFAEFYAKQPHQGLEGRTPHEVFFKNKPKQTIIKENLDYLMRKIENRVVGVQGIRINKELYWDEELLNHVGKRVTIRYDFKDLSSIKAYSAENVFLCNAPIRELQSPILDSDESKRKLNEERAQIENVANKIKKSTGKIINEVKDDKYTPLLNSSDKKPTILYLAQIPPKPWERQNIYSKKKFELFIEYYGKRFTLKEATKILNIKYETLKKIAQPLYDVKIVRVGLKDGSYLLEKKETSKNESTSEQLAINYDIAPK